MFNNLMRFFALQMSFFYIKCRILKVENVKEGDWLNDNDK